jgi:hypothetical protein
MTDPPKFKLTFFFYPKAYDRCEGLSMGLTASQGHEQVRREARILHACRHEGKVAAQGTVTSAIAELPQLVD